MAETAVSEIVFQRVCKVFGARPEVALAMCGTEASKDEIRAATGQVAALRDVTLDVARGELFVVMGLSGCGKSTLLRLVNGLIAPTRGNVSVAGQDIAGLAPSALREFRRNRVAMVFQRFGLFPHRSVVENVAYGLEVQGVPREARRARAKEWLDRVGLAADAEAMPGALSGGMQQRVGLARALATDPDILLMDEPFGSLDPLIRRDMQDELVALRSGLPKTVLFVTHDMSEALFLGDRIAVLRDGAVEQVGTPQDLLDSPATGFVAAFVRSAERRLRPVKA